MSFHFWTILLIAALAQCIFLLVVFLVKPLANRNARLLLIVLLSIVLCTLFSNAWMAANLYRVWVFPSLFTRGMVLLLGPVCYMYVIASIKPQYRFSAGSILHFIPYAIVVMLNFSRLPSLDKDALISSIDEFVAGRAVIEPVSYLQFVGYSLHMIIYLLLVYRQTKRIPVEGNYIVTLEHRMAWLQHLGRLLTLVPVIFASYSLYLLVKGVYTIEGNILYTVALSIVVYVIAYQAMRNQEVLVPGFDKKYGAQKQDTAGKEKILARVLAIFEKEEVFTDPRLTVGLLAEKAGVPAHTVSRLINENLRKTFTEILNEYRIAAFTRKLVDPGYTHYSISGLASEVGYQSKSTFHSAFKKIMQQTPSEYIKNSTGEVRSTNDRKEI